MAKKVVGYIKLQIPAGKATPAPPVGPALGQHSVDKLLLLVKQRITDRRVLKLIKGWLKAGVLENGRYSESTLGAPQGGVISPLLSNIYLNYFDVYWNKAFGHLGELVRYADDL